MFNIYGKMERRDDGSKDVQADTEGGWDMRVFDAVTIFQPGPFFIHLLARSPRLKT